MPANRVRLQQTGFSRVFTIDGGAAPQVSPVYQGLARAGALTWKLGDTKPQRIPSRLAYDQFDIEATIKGQRDLPQLPLQLRKVTTRSSILDLARKGCKVDIQIHVGACKQPTDFDGGWIDGLVGILEQADLNSYDTEQLGAMDADQRAAIHEMINATGLDWYEVGPLSPATVADALITDEGMDVLVADAITCGSCGLPSDGCQLVFELQKASVGSVGISASVVYTKDGWATSAKSILTTLAIGKHPTAMVAMGAYLVVFSNDDLSHSYVKIADLLAGTGVWTKVSTGYVVAKGPNGAVNVTPNLTLIVGDGGYVYKMTDPTAAVTVVSAGVATTQILNRVDSIGDTTIVAVGATNALLVSQDGGSTWSLVTGPNAGVTLLSVSCETFNRWFIGDAGGNLWYTLDGGSTWTSKVFNALAGSGNVRDVNFVTQSVGYLVHDVAAVGYLYRTINGGNSWFRVPEASGLTLPSNQRLNRLAACGSANLVFAAGLNSNGTDGILIKAAG